MPETNRHVRHEFTRAWLIRSWWFLFPSFTGLSVRLAAERACADPYNLLPAVSADARWTWPLALVYVMPHVWLVGAYLQTASRADAIVPGVSVFRELWGKDVAKLILMAGVLAFESLPIPMWRLIGRAFHCRP